MCYEFHVILCFLALVLCFFFPFQFIPIRLNLSGSFKKRFLFIVLMALEDLFETALRQVEVSGLLPRAFAERTSKPVGYLVIGLHTRNFLDINFYDVRSITDLTVL